MYSYSEYTDWSFYDLTGYHKRRYYLPSYHTMDFFIFHDQQPFTGHAPQRGDRKNRIPYIRHIPVGERRNQLYPDFRKIRCTGNGNPRCCHRNFCSTHTELGIVLFYVWKKDTKVKLFDEKFRDGIIGKGSGTVWKTFFKVCIPILTSGLLWAVSLPMQTAILGHLSADAIAANSVSSTFFQYLKVIVIAIAGASAVVIGKDIGSNDEEKVRCNGRTLSVLYLAIGLLLGTVLFLLRSPLLSMYRLTPQATLYADHFMIIMSVIMVGMSYQMPVGVGIIQGGGDTKFSMYLNLISVWCIVMPLSFLAAFYWKLPVELVVIAVQSDQIFKCLPIFLRFKSYKWIHKLTAID